MSTPIPPKAVLVVCVRYLGDTLLLRPVFHALHQAFPEARLDALVTAGTSCALDDCPGVNRVIEWPRQAPFKEMLLLPRLALGGYTWVFDFTGNDRSALACMATLAPLRVAYDRPKMSKWALRRVAYNLKPRHKKQKPHTLIQRLELLEACGVTASEYDFALHPRSDALAWAQEAIAGLPSQWIHAHVTSRDMQKALPPSVVKRVLSDLLSRGHGVVLTSGPAEVETQHLAACTEGLPMDRIRTFSHADWHQLVALISLAKKYWGSDTAPAHIAAALRKPMLIHYGPSRADHWRPLHPEGHADIRSCTCLKEKKVLCPKGKTGRCLEDISPTAVVDWFESGQ